MITTYEQIANWLNMQKITIYYIRPDLTVDVHDSVILQRQGLTKLPVKFGKVTGCFDCSGNSLNSFVNFPTIINGDLIFAHNCITSIEHFPQYIAGNVYGVYTNKLTDSDVKKLENMSISMRREQIKNDTINPNIGMDLLKEEYMTEFVNGTVYDVTFKEFLNKKLM